MGMYDESWCAGCGVGIHYTEDESAMCHNCNEEGYVELETRSSKFMEYLKAYLNSLEQDLEKLLSNKSVIWGDGSKDQEIYLNGQIHATRHILSVATDIMNNSNERV